MTKNASPMRPTPAVLCKLGSIAVHVEEFLSPRGHPLDRVALTSLLNDPEVTDWLAQMAAMAMLPAQRNRP